MEPQDQINTDQPEITEPTVAEVEAEQAQDQPKEPETTEKPMKDIERVSVNYRMRATGDGTFEYVMQIDPSLWEQFRVIIAEGCKQVIGETVEVGFEFTGWIGEEPANAAAESTKPVEPNPAG